MYAYCKELICALGLQIHNHMMRHYVGDNQLIHNLETGTPFSLSHLKSDSGKKRRMDPSGFEMEKRERVCESVLALRWFRDVCTGWLKLDR